MTKPSSIRLFLRKSFPDLCEVGKQLTHSIWLQQVTKRAKKKPLNKSHISISPNRPEQEKTQALAGSSRAL